MNIKILLTQILLYAKINVSNEGSNKMIDYNYIISILKDFGRTKGHVWLVKGYCNNAYKVQLKYDTTRRYFMTPIYNKTEKIPSMCRVPQDVFENNVKYLLQNGYTISF
jgi:hypothetical protein